MKLDIFMYEHKKLCFLRGQIIFMYRHAKSTLPNINNVALFKASQSGRTYFAMDIMP